MTPSPYGLRRAAGSHPGSALSWQHHGTTSPCHCWVPPMGPRRSQRRWGKVRFGQALAPAPGATGGQWGGVLAPSLCPPSRLWLHRISSSGKSPGIPDPNHTSGPGWAPCPEALGMGISALGHWQEQAPSTLPAWLLSVCTGSTQATSWPHCPHCQVEGKHCRCEN